MSPEADALLDAIWDNPGEDTPRLVYADWLQENGHGDYAEFIRLSVRIKRGSLTPGERARLRRERHVVGRRVVAAHPRAARLVLYADPRDGIPPDADRFEARAFLREWEGWGPFVRPRRLTLHDLSGREAEVSTCPYLRRVVALQCDGLATVVWGQAREEAEWEPVAGAFLTALAARDDLPKLVALRVEPIRATADQLLRFADSPLAGRLEEVHLWVEFADGGREDLRRANGFVRHEVHTFVAHHGDRLPLA